MARKDGRPVPAADRGHRHRRAARRNSSRASIDDLAWLGVDWEKPLRRQSEHFSEYRAVLDRLVRRGAGLPRLHEPRRDPRLHLGRRDAEASRGRAIPTACRSIPALDRRCRSASGGGASPRARHSPGGSTSRRRRPGRRTSRRPLSWTESRARSIRRPAGRSRRSPQQWGDVVLARKDVPTSYHLSVVVDDAAARRQPRGARPRPLRGDVDPAAAAATAGLARAGLFPPPPDRRAGRAQTVEERKRHGLAARCGRAARRRPISGG